MILPHTKRKEVEHDNKDKFYIETLKQIYDCNYENTNQKKLRKKKVLKRKRSTSPKEKAVDEIVAPKQRQSGLSVSINNVQYDSYMPSPVQVGTQENSVASEKMAPALQSPSIKKSQKKRFQRKRAKKFVPAEEPDEVEPINLPISIEPIENIEFIEDEEAPESLEVLEPPFVADETYISEPERYSNLPYEPLATSASQGNEIPAVPL